MLKTDGIKSRTFDRISFSFTKIQPQNAGHHERANLLQKGRDFTSKTFVHLHKDLVWQNFCVPFTAKSGSTTIGFLNEDPNNDTGNILDDVTVEPVR
jgi:hypothetical protein